VKTKTPAGLEISWTTLEGMVKGKSAIDFQEMGIENLADAEQFILNYGYDYQQPEDRSELENLRQEAVSFIQRRFLDTAASLDTAEPETFDLKIPEALVENADIRTLILAASDKDTLLQSWACAILKVMHTLCHIHNAMLYNSYEEAKLQILLRYNTVLLHTDNGELRLGQNGATLPIAGFEIKDEKSRDSMLLKLLCKRENVAEEIFDLMGVRIITFSAAEALLALEILRRNRVVIFPNIIPSRSRNSLIDFDAFKAQFQTVLDSSQWNAGSLSQTLAFIQTLSPQEAAEEFNPNNPSTLASYRSLHLTERQLIRFKHPVTQEETRFFFPYEIQIVDEASYRENHSGSSAHALYKQNQLLQARRRVLGPVLLALKKQARHTAKRLELDVTP
jgi:uncharacterized protein (TIGR04562 family)